MHLHGVHRPAPSGLAEFIGNFLDTLGIGSFVPDTACFKLERRRCCGRPTSPRPLEQRRNRLDFQVGLEGLPTELASPAGLLVPTEGYVRRDGPMTIDRHLAGADSAHEAVRRRKIACPDAARQTVHRVVRHSRHRVEVERREAETAAPPATKLAPSRRPRSMKPLTRSSWAREIKGPI